MDDGVPGNLLRAVDSGQMGVTKARGGRTAQRVPVLEGVPKQMPRAGAAAGYTPWRSSYRAMHRRWNKDRAPSPSCSTGRVMN